MHGLNSAVRIGPPLILTGVLLQLTVRHLQPPAPVTAHSHDGPVREPDLLLPGHGDCLAGSVWKCNGGLS